jgi:LPS-assembly lipoprotein
MRHFFTLIALLSLAACGFTPVHKQNAAGTAISDAYAHIVIPSIPDREGQYLRNQLIDRIYTNGRPMDAKYRLEIEPIKTNYTDLGIQKDATVTRTQIELGTRVKLVEIATSAVLLDRKLHSVGGYDVLDQQYTTVITRRSNTDNILQELADNIMTELNLYLATVAR